jgi:hypothetical protein
MYKTNFILVNTVVNSDGNELSYQKNKAGNIPKKAPVGAS